MEKLNTRDFDSGKGACEAFVEKLPKDALVFFCDEAYFHLSECVNKQSMRYSSDANPPELHEQPLHAERVTVWCTLLVAGIIEPWFFYENDKAIAVTCDRYIQMNEELFLP